MLNRTSIILDPLNNPKHVEIGGYILPYDVIISLDGEKIIAESKILDGVAVFERILRSPVQINMFCTARQIDGQDNKSVDSTVQNATGTYIFAQDVAKGIWENVFELDSVQKIKNTFLNSLGIQEIVIKKISINTVQGNMNVPMTIEMVENYTPTDKQGQTLIVK